MSGLSKSSDDPSLKFDQAKLEREFTFECSACGKPLLDIMLEDTEVESMMVAVSCPFCGDKSFAKKIDRLFRFCPHPNLVVEDMEYEDVLLIKMLEV